MKIRCNDRTIEVSYCPLCKHYLGLIGDFLLPVSSSQTKIVRDLTPEEYADIEETALAYLLKEAVDKSGRKTLLGIAGIKQDIDFFPVDNSLEINLSLRGLAVYSR